MGLAQQGQRGESAICGQVLCGMRKLVADIRAIQGMDGVTPPQMGENRAE